MPLTDVLMRAMGLRLSRSGSSQSLLPERRRRRPSRDESDTDSLDGLDRREDIAQFPYVEFTGRDSVTCPSCQGTGRMPSGQVNELVALIPYSDQRLRPQRTKLYVVLSVVLCLLASGLGAFFLFPRSVIVVFDGLRSVTVHFDHTEQKVLMKLTSTLNFTNPNFFSVLVQSLSCQVLYMKTEVGTSQMDNVTTVLPLSQVQVNYSVNVEIGSSAPYVYTFCTMPTIKVHNIVVFMETSVKSSYMMRTSQNNLESYPYMDCGANSTFPHRTRQNPVLNEAPPAL